VGLVTIFRTRQNRRVSRWPNLFIVGAARAGTTSLWRYLDEHPAIYMASVKEPNFFSQVEGEFGGSVLSEDEYLQLFTPGANATFRGEASASYLWHPDVPTTIARVAPDAKILISLREPVDRAYSVYWHRVRNGLEPRPFATAVREELRSLQAGLPARYVGPGSLYADNVAGYLRAFAQGLHALFFEDLACDARFVVRQIFEFLALDSTVAERVRLEAHNSFALPTNRVNAGLLRSRTARSFGRVFIPTSIRQNFERRMIAPAQQPDIDVETRELLTDLYREDVLALGRVLGREPPWPAYRSSVTAPGAA
jgi:hypothetical protein